MSLLSLWPVINLTIYNTPLISTVIFGIDNGVESVKLSLLAKSHAQLVYLVAWQVPRTHQGTYCRSHHSVIFQL